MARKPLSARKTARAQKAGYEGPTAAAAQSSVTKQYGMVKDAEGNWTKPSAAFLESQLSSQGLNQGQPVAIGGARWMDQAGALTFTGERSDSAKRNPGAAAGAEGQTAYEINSGTLKKTGRNTTRKRTTGRVLGGRRIGVGAPEVPLTDMPTTEPVYAEADITTTGYGAAQGKAYGKGKGSSTRGATGGGGTKESATEAAGTGPRPKKHGPKNKRVYQKARKAKAKNK